MSEPLCGWTWLEEHIRDHTHAEIEALAIEIRHDDKPFATIKAEDHRGTVKELVKLRKGS